MAATARMPTSSRSQPLEQFKPRQGAKQHMQCSTSPKEPFDADLLSRRLESYRREVKLEKARREVAELKSRETSWSTLPDTEKKTTIRLPQEEKKTVSDPVKSSSEVQRSKSLNISQTLNVTEQPERKRSIIHHRHKQPDARGESPSAPYIPRFAAKQFSSTTATLQKDKSKIESKSTSTKEKSKSEIKPTPIKDAGRQKHKLDWAEPLPKTVAVQAVPTETSNDSPIRRAAFLNIQNSASANPRQRPLSTALENLRIAEHEHNPYILSSSPLQPQHKQHDAPAVAQSHPRPHLKGNRHDWSQASQCGDSARASLHLRRKDISSEDAELAGLKSTYGGKGKRRQKSHGDSPDGLVNAAVRLIREEKKKTGIFAVFRRH